MTTAFPLMLLLQDDAAQAAASRAAAGVGTGVLVVELIIFALWIVGMWKVFQKAGEPGWAAIIPIYNVFVLLKIAGKPAWWIILLLIPFVNFLILIPVSLAVAERFGKSAGFGIGLWLLPFIFYPLLGFSDARYGGSPAPAMA